MDDDVKTLLALLALFYGSSNGIGLLRNTLKTVEERTAQLDEVTASTIASADMLLKTRRSLGRALLSFGPLIYCAVVLLLPFLLLLVVLFGPTYALGILGLATSAFPATPASKGNLFYWILLVLTLLATAEWLSPYLKGCRSFFSSFRKAQESKQ